MSMLNWLSGNSVQLLAACLLSFIFGIPIPPMYHIHGNFRGMKFSLNRKQTGFSRLYFCESQVNRGMVACVMYCYKSLIVQTSKFLRIKFLLYPYVSDHEIREIYLPWKFLRVRYKVTESKVKLVTYLPMHLPL